MRRLALALVLPLLLAGTAAYALSVPRGNARDDRVRTVIYDPMNVTKIVGVIRSVRRQHLWDRLRVFTNGGWLVHRSP